MASNHQRRNLLNRPFPLGLDSSTECNGLKGLRSLR